jgi:hypothetical protein
MQLLSPESHEVEIQPCAESPSSSADGQPVARPAAATGAGLADRVSKLEAEVAELRAEVRRLSGASGGGGAV